MENKLEHKDVYKFEYRGITCEIEHWGVGVMCDGKGMWNSYLIIRKKQLPKNFKKLIPSVFQYRDRKDFNYGEINKYFEFHGEITYFNALVDPITMEIFGIKVGDDYGHLWDSERGYQYDIEEVKRNAEKNIDTFIKNFKDYRIFNHITGKYVKENYEK